MLFAGDAPATDRSVGIGCGRNRLHHYVERTSSSYQRVESAIAFVVAIVRRSIFSQLSKIFGLSVAGDRLYSQPRDIEHQS
ncbi:hypothetical protein [Chamaesiphon sp.]|uniref:hypothetical protein n=1 Tax=Chamaesiphon sp. TaxID=2814140 RepID=UPI00359338D9